MKLSTAFEMGVTTASGLSLAIELIKPHMSPVEQGLALAVFAISSTLAVLSGDQGAEKFKQGMESNFNHRGPFWPNTN